MWPPITDAPPIMQLRPIVVDPATPTQAAIAVPAADPAVVGDLDLVVELDAVLDHRVVERAAVDRGVGTDLDVIADHDPAELRHSRPSRPCAGTNPKPRPPITAPGSSLRPGADQRIGTDVDVRFKPRTGADRGPAADHAVRADIAAGADHHFGFDHRAGARCRSRRRSGPTESQRLPTDRCRPEIPRHDRTRERCRRTPMPVRPRSARCRRSSPALRDGRR